MAKHYCPTPEKCGVTYHYNQDACKSRASSGKAQKPNKPVSAAPPSTKKREVSPHEDSVRSSYEGHMTGPNGGYTKRLAISEETFDKLADSIRDVELRSNPEIRQAYRDRNITNGEGVKDIEKRFRNDLLYASGGSKHLYEYDDLNDSQIDSALKRIVPPLGD